MKKLFTAIMLAAVVFALVLPGCGNKEPEVPVGPAPGAPPVGPVAPGSHYEGGYLAGPGASYTFTVNAGSVTYLEVPFTYPVGSVDFWSRWLGRTATPFWAILTWMPARLSSFPAAARST